MASYGWLPNPHCLLACIERWCSHHIVLYYPTLKHGESSINGHLQYLKWPKGTVHLGSWLPSEEDKTTAKTAPAPERQRRSSRWHAAWAKMGDALNCWVIGPSGCNKNIAVMVQRKQCRKETSIIIIIIIIIIVIIVIMVFYSKNRNWKHPKIQYGWVKLL